MDPYVPHPAEKLVSRGKPSGDRLDHLWKRIEARSEVKEPARVRLWLWLGPLMAATASVLFFVVLPGRPGFQERGAPDLEPPVMEATCGGQGPSCRAGSELFLRLAPYSRGGFIQVVLQTQSGPVLVAHGLQPRADGVVAVPARLVPDAVDVQRGLQVEAWRVEERLSPSAVEHWLHAPYGVHSTLRLVVEP